MPDPIASTTRAPVVGPRLKPTHRPLWRDATTVQLGLAVERAVVLGGMTERSARLLHTLDRGGPVADDPLVVRLLAGSGVLDAVGGAAPVADRLLPERALLGLVHPSPELADRALAARAATRVVVHGGGRVGSTVAHLLAASGLGRVTVVDRQPVTAADACPGGVSTADVGLRRGAAATAVAVRAAPPQLDAGPPDLVIVCPDGASPADPEIWWPALLGGAAVVCGSVREAVGVVGPFTLPHGRCCPGCLTLHRTDRDPAWPLLERQLADPERAPASTAAATVAVAVAAAVAEQALTWVDGRAVRAPVAPASVGATLELPRPGWRWHRRPWGAHPECRCADLEPPP